MTTYSTSFDSYTVDVQPSDWTVRWDTANSTFAVKSKSAVEGGKTLQHTATVAGFHLLSSDAVDADANRANVEILARVRSSNASSQDQFWLAARASGSTGATSTFYLLQPLDATGGWALRKCVSGAGTTLATLPVSTGWTANVWYYLRFRVNGTTLSAKVWADGTPEPSAWQMTATDSAISAAGWSGVACYTASGTRDFDWVSFGTNGDTAPLSTSTATPIRTHQDVLEAGLATVANARSHQDVLEAGLATVARARSHQDVLEVAIGGLVYGYAHQLVLEVAISQAATVTQQPRMIVIM